MTHCCLGTSAEINVYIYYSIICPSRPSPSLLYQIFSAKQCSSMLKFDTTFSQTRKVVLVRPSRLDGKKTNNRRINLKYFYISDLKIGVFNPTTDNPSDEKTTHCHFPFLYEGKVYHTCQVQDISGLAWCSLTYDYDTDQELGYCLSPSE